MLDVCLLGCGGMMPLPHRALTSCFIRAKGTGILIDCGEGTQVSLHEKGWGFKGIDALLLTHYHGDHVGGLPGLLLTIGNADRTEPLHIYGPKGLSRVVRSLLVIAPELPFDIVLHELSSDALEPFSIGEFRVAPFKVDHGMPCLGYRLELPRGQEFLPDKARANAVPLPLWSRLQKGESVELDGKLYTPDMVLGAARKGLSLCYCTDSLPNRNIVEGARNVDLLICEGMYGEAERQSRANNYKHMTFAEAAQIASVAGAKELWLTHFSPSLIYPKEALPEARAIFANTVLGKDRLTKVFTYDDELSDSGH